MSVKDILLNIDPLFSHRVCYELERMVRSLRAFLSSACAVSAMLCEVAVSGVSSGGMNDGAEVKGDTDFDVVLCQSELTERALQLCYLLPPGFMPVSFSS